MKKCVLPAVMALAFGLGSVAATSANAFGWPEDRLAELPGNAVHKLIQRCSAKD